MIGAGYGFAAGHKITRLAPMPLAHEASIRSRAQSLLSRNGRVVELPSYREALTILRRAEMGNAKPLISVTVPPPREPVAPVATPATTPVHAAPASAQAAGNSMPACPATAHDPSPSVAAGWAGANQGENA